MSDGGFQPQVEGSSARCLDVAAGQGAPKPYDASHGDCRVAQIQVSVTGTHQITVPLLTTASFGMTTMPSRT